MPTAHRLYSADAALFDFEATVSDIREYARKDGVQVWQIALDRTAFYPTSGGQPHDIGSLTARSRSGAELTVAIDDVVEDGNGEVWHTTTKPLLTGTKVRGQVDAARRFDHMQQHTGQHLLSAVLASGFGLVTESFHLGDVDATIDLRGETREEETAALARLAEAEEQANRHIAANLQVSVSVVENSKAQSLLAEGALRKLPPREGDIRLVEIPGIDLNACGGTHVSALGQIGSIQLRGVERVKKTLRLHFVCGLRAVRAARADFNEVSAAAATLSVGARDVAAAVKRLKTENRDLTKDRQHLREEIASRHAVQLVVEERIDGGIRLVHRMFADRDAEYIRLLATRLMLAVPHTAAVLVSTVKEPATVVFASNMAIDEAPSQNCAALLREVLEPLKLRGGGTPEMAQAEVPLRLVHSVSAELIRLLNAG